MTSETTTLIWGAGAIGGTIGAWLLRAGHDVAFVDTQAEHVEAIRTTGLSIKGPVDSFTIKGRAFLPSEVQGKYSRILLSVKAVSTDAALEALLPHLAEDGYVVSLQNGLCEKTIAARIGAERTMGAFINFGADWIGPGDIAYGNRGAVVVGEINGQMTERLAQLHKDLQIFEPNAIQTPEIWGYLWGKLGYLTLLYAQAVGEKGIADCLARPELFDLFVQLVRETNAVAEAEGVRPIGFDGFDPAAFGKDRSRAEMQKTVDDLVTFNAASAKTHSGIWRDLAVRKRLTEVDHQIGQISTLAARHGIKTPAVAALVQQIKEIETGARQCSDDNLLELKRVALGA